MFLCDYKDEARRHCAKCNKPNTESEMKGLTYMGSLIKNKYLGDLKCSHILLIISNSLPSSSLSKSSLNCGIWKVAELEIVLPPLTDKHN